jgi:hypothetical protein
MNFPARAKVHNSLKSRDETSLGRCLLPEFCRDNPHVNFALSLHRYSAAATPTTASQSLYPECIAIKRLLAQKNPNSKHFTGRMNCGTARALAVTVSLAIVDKLGKVYSAGSWRITRFKNSIPASRPQPFPNPRVV